MEQTTQIITSQNWHKAIGFLAVLARLGLGGGRWTFYLEAP
jgi:hypothetical protein